MTASPGMLRATMESNLRIDVRPILPTLTAPTLTGYGRRFAGRLDWHPARLWNSGGRSRAAPGFIVCHRKSGLLMDALRTPDDRFSSLSGFRYPARYVEDLPGSPGLRMAYIDDGPADAARTYLCLHGQPTWSYLYRKMIPVFRSAGGRVIAPDFFGFGRSDKPVDDAAYTFEFHRRSLIDLITQLDLRDITLVVQDWGGLLGLTLPVDIDMRPRITRLIIMNTALAVGKPLGPGFEAWRDYATSTDDLAVGRLLRRSEPSSA